MSISFDPSRYGQETKNGGSDCIEDAAAAGLDANDAEDDIAGITRYD